VEEIFPSSANVIEDEGKEEEDFWYRKVYGTG
jgi:hypothetical protein